MKENIGKIGVFNPLIIAKNSLKRKLCFEFLLTAVSRQHRL